MAYKQPVTRLEIEKIRGVKSDHAVNKLVEYGLVEEKDGLKHPDARCSLVQRRSFSAVSVFSPSMNFRP